MKKLIAFFVSVLIGFSALLDSYWLFFANKISTQVSPDLKSTVPTIFSKTVKVPPVSSTGKQSNSTTTKSSSTVRSVGKYKDGTYTGTVINTSWGAVQVQVTISGSQITNVTMIQSTSSDGQTHSELVDSQAEPIYISETKSSQSSKIQAVSGATVTYYGYTNSLQSALDQAVI
ncbi:FMN-binding protein [Lactococcus fujiensis]|uniref:FMN-binding domain-containing protein n=1 Tax=Lactococcus fujiensis JCM 16395 TaxID=1291764 RepID=A0A2A5RHV3_9LACT|nr:FMN-binding protein [Lactococcus fujiensis]PCR98688.1 hypothetical protein RT41_GL001195 [Lactococcus fujiensis JCM 16395]